MILTVDTASPVPPYEQVREQVTTMVASGVLRPGMRLPTIRQLASDLEVAPGTITRAYRELEASGVVVSRGRHGTFIAEKRVIGGAERRERLTSEARRYARFALQLGASPADVVAAVESELRAHAADG